MRGRVLALATSAALVIGMLSAPAAHADEPAAAPVTTAESAVATEIARASARLGVRSNEVLFAHVTLTRSERSPIAALVTEMLEDLQI